MQPPPRTRRRWVRRSLIALPVLAAVIFVGGCGSVVYVHTIWEAGNHRCGTALGKAAGKKLDRHGGWHIGFNGQSDAFVCTVNDAKLRVVAQTEVPVQKVLGGSGRLPLWPELMAHALEAVDDDAP
jgi:hypothetical protein